MRTILMLTLFAALSYLVGSIPFGLLIARGRGVDIRSVGSGNIGATNVFRSVGKGWGLLTFLCDALKGFLPAFLLPRLAGDYLPDPTLGAVIFGCLAVAGHNFPITLGFKGGKGVATSAGALLGIAPAAVGIGIVVWALTVAITRYVSVASMLAAAGIAASSWWLYQDEGRVIPIALTLLGMLAIARHHANIRRLLRGEENRFGTTRKHETHESNGGQGE